MKKQFILLAIFFCQNLIAHCEIPCGIYGDAMRFEMIDEHIATIEKSMREIHNTDSTNQLVRWITNKEDHASKIQEIVSQYFLTQRIKPSDEHYHRHLEFLHQMLIKAMECKQTTDLDRAEALRNLNHQLRDSYLR